MTSTFQIGISLLAIDNFSGKFNALGANIGKLEKYASNVSNALRSAATPYNLALAAGATSVMKAFAETEDATIQLQNTMMGAGGTVSSFFADVSAKAEELGAQLPGTTADFYKMASAMRALGVGDASLSSALEATAKMAVVLKPVGVSFEEAAEATAKFKGALGIADGDMVKFADTVQRSVHLGAKLPEMQYAFSRMAGTMKVLGLQGLDSANAMTPLLAMLIRTGKTGETVGTSLTKIFSMGMAKKQFTNVEGMFDFLQKTDNETLTKIFGSGDDAQTALLLKNMGLKEYLNTMSQMKGQASLNERIDNSLNTLTNTWEAMTGAANKAAVAFGGIFAGPLKTAASGIGYLADKMSLLIEKFPMVSGGLGAIMVALLSIPALKAVGNIFGTLFGPGIAIIKNLTMAFRVLNLAQGANRVLWATRVIKEYGIVGRAAVLVTKLMTLAQGAYNAVAAMNPYLLLVMGVVALTGATIALVSWLGRAKTSQEELNEIKEEAKERTADERASLEVLFIRLRKTNAGTQERIALVKKLKDEFPGYAANLNLENASLQEIEKSYQNVGKAMEERARKEIAYERLKEAVKEQMQAESDAQEYRKVRKEGGVSALWAGMWGNAKGEVFGSAEGNLKEANDKVARISELASKIGGVTENKNRVQVTNNVTIQGNADAATVNAMGQKLTRVSTPEDNRGYYVKIGI